MTSGDVVANIATSNLTFQPAAGVECCIMALGSLYDTNGFAYFRNGTNNSPIWYAGDGASNSTLNSATFQGKMFINNTIYLYINMTGTNPRSYSGIQTK